MLVKCDNSRIYDVRFHKEIINRERRKQTLNMFCSVSLVDDTKIGKEKYILIGKGLAKQSIKDRTDKVLGRKLAFGRAIKGFNKPIRTVFWETFKSNFSI